MEMSSSSPRRSRAASPPTEPAAPIPPRSVQASQPVCLWKKPCAARRILSQPRSRSIMPGTESTRSIMRRRADDIFFPSLLPHRFDRRRRLRLLLAFPGALPELDALPNCADDERLRMLRSGLGHDFIDRAPRRDRLEQFLELAFRVHVDRFFHELRQVRRGLFENKFSRPNEVAVQIDRP